MSVRRYVAGRVLWTVFAGFAILSAAFLLFAFVPDPDQTLVAFSGGEEALEAYREARNYGDPLWERYVAWIVAYVTLDFGTTVNGEPVSAVLLDRAPYTLVYLVPGILLGNVAGVLVGHLAGMRGGWFDSVSSAVSYVGFGVPAFWMGELLIVLFIEQLSWYRAYYDTRFGLWTADNLVSLTLPLVVVALNVFVVQLRYSRAETLEFASADFVRTFRANGAAFRDRSRHVLKNAALPLVSLFFTETLTVLFVTVYAVELVFRVPGLGQLAFQGLVNRDFAIILATTIIPVYIGLLGNLVQDVTYAALDPRVDVGE